MSLTEAQQTTLKNDILADPVLGQLAPSSDAINKIIDAYKVIVTPTYLVWNKAVPVDDINNAVDMGKYVSVEPPASSNTYTNMTLNCQTKLMTLHSFILRTGTVNAEKPKVRSGLHLAVTNIPSGPNAGLQSAAGVDGVDVLNACTRAATRLEKLLVARTETTGPVTAGICGATGTLGYDQVRTLMGW